MAHDPDDKKIRTGRKVTGDRGKAGSEHQLRNRIAGTLESSTARTFRKIGGESEKRFQHQRDILSGLDPLIEQFGADAVAQSVASFSTRDKGPTDSRVEQRLLGKLTFGPDVTLDKIREAAAIFQGGEPDVGLGFKEFQGARDEARVQVESAFQSSKLARSAEAQANNARLRATQVQRARRAGLTQDARSTTTRTTQGVFDPANLARRRLRSPFFAGGA